MPKYKNKTLQCAKEATLQGSMPTIFEGVSNED
jgi:hypothetical protein